jgi:hypothetical protein
MVLIVNPCDIVLKKKISNVPGTFRKKRMLETTNKIS